MLDILLIEDNYIDIDLFNEYITEYNHKYNIKPITRLTEAIEFMKKDPEIDLILLDLNLPDSSGIDTFERILEIRGDIPIIVLTGLNDQFLAKETISKGAGDYLVKNKLNPYVIHKSITHTIEREKSRKLMKEKELQVLQNQKMEAIGRLAGGIVHDFNNLISIIQGYSELLINQAEEMNIGKKFIPSLKEIIRASKSGANLIEQLLLFCRKKEVIPEVINLKDVINNINFMLKRIAPRNINLEIEFGEEQYIVEFNQTQMEQIIINLVVNSIDAINAKKQNGEGKISIIINTISSDQLKNKNEWNNIDRIIQLSIQDNGIGMDEETQKKVFEPFFTTKKMGEGTGLGLSTVYGLVNNNNGMIEIESKCGDGTIFQIYLPAYEGTLEEDYNHQEQSNRDNFSEKASTSSYTVMIVEDNQSLRLLISNILNSLGLELMSFQDGSEAMNYLQINSGEKIDLIISDLMMPHLHGMELYEWVSANLECKIPFLIISGYNDEITQISDMNKNENISYLNKPFDISEFKAVVKNLLYNE